MGKPVFASIEKWPPPKDTDIVLWPHFNSDPVVGYLYSEDNLFYDNDGRDVKPTHWHYVGEIPE